MGALAALHSIPGHAQTSIGRQARDWKITQCLRSIDALADFLTAETKFSARSVSGNDDPDKELYSVSLVAQPIKGEAARRQPYFAHAVVAPLSGGGCNASYDVVSYYPQSCEAVHASALSNFTKRVAFGDHATTYATPDDKVIAYMLPAQGQGAGQGCTVIKQQTLYQVDLP
jgi:hypothetical protein